MFGDNLSCYNNLDDGDEDLSLQPTTLGAVFDSITSQLVKEMCIPSSITKQVGERGRRVLNKP